MNDQDRSAVILICKAIQEAGKPLSRVEIIRSIAQEPIPDMGRILELMIHEGILKAQERKSENNTSMFCYSLKADFDLEQWLEAFG